MLWLTLIVGVHTPAVEIESCAELFDVGAVQTLPMHAHLLCERDTVFVAMEGASLPHTAILNLETLPFGERAARVGQSLRALKSGARGPPLRPQDLRRLATRPHSWTIPIRMLGEGVLPISVMDADDNDVFICNTPCTVHVAPGAKLVFVRGGLDSGVRRFEEVLDVPDDLEGLDVRMRAPSQVQFVTGGVLIGLTAAMTVLGIALVSTSPTYLPPGAVGMSFLFIAPLVVLPIGVPMMAANHGGRPKVGPLGALQSVRVSLSGLQIRF